MSAAFALFQVLTVLGILFLLLWWDRITRGVRIRGLPVVALGVFFVLIGKISGFLAGSGPLEGTLTGAKFLPLLRSAETTAGTFGHLVVAVGLVVLVPSIYSILSTKKNIEQSDERYKLITENVSDVIFLVDLNFNWLYITPSVHKFRGYTPDEALKQKISDVLTPDSIKLVRKVVRSEYLRDRTPGLDPDRVQTLELDFYHKDGSIVTGEVTSSFLRDEEGRIVGLQGSNRDISERKRAEKALQESEERFRKAFMLNPEAVALNRLEDGMFVEYNQKFMDTSGFSSEDLDGRTMLEVGIWADLEQRQRFLDLIMEKGTVQDFEVQFKRKSGDIGTGLTSATLVNLAGETHLLTITKDITEMRAAQVALVESEEKFRSTLEAIGDCVIILDDTFEITWANDRAREKIGTQRGAKCYQAIMGIEECCSECNARLTFQDGMIRTAEKTFTGLGDNGGQFLVTCAPILDGEGKIKSVVETIKDISELKQAEEKIVKALQEKEILLKEIHHRVKNNLQAISGLLDIQALRAEDLRSKGAIKESQNRILSMALIHEHLYRHQDLSRINFKSYTDQLVRNLAISYDSGNRAVELEVTGEEIALNPDTAIPCSLILMELVSNAYKHAFSAGSGRITVHLEDVEDGTYRMSVRDDGGSMPEDVDIHTTDSFGLMLVRTFVDLLEGGIEMAPGEETAFVITFREYRESNNITL